MLCLFLRLMNKHSIELVQKVIKSFDEYFKHIPDDCLLAMSVNPLLVTLGFADILVLLEEDGEGEKLQSRAKKLLQKFVTNVLKAQEKAPKRPTAAEQSDGDKEVEGEVLSNFKSLC